MRKNKKAHHASKTRHKLVVYYNDYRLDFLQLILSKISGKYIERENNIIHQSIQHHRGINPPHSVGLIGPLGLNPRPLPRNPLPRPRPAPKQTPHYFKKLNSCRNNYFCSTLLLFRDASNWRRDAQNKNLCSKNRRILAHEKTRGTEGAA